VVREWADPDLNRGPPPCESGVLTRLDDRPTMKTGFSSRFKLWVPCYFLSPTDLFFSLRTEA
jgi:hypothetical protein